MSTNPGNTGAVARQLEALWTSGTLTGLSDAQLLGRFAESRTRDATAEAAFRELIDRHGPMVMGVCRQILRRPHDADDAFQATFLVLVRKARSIRVVDSLAPWLYGVAYRTAHRARTVASRYRPADVEPMEEPMGPSPDDAFDFDLRPLLHEELSRLPGKYRDPIVLCHLEGKSHEEAARLLQWPVGTVSGRLSRGRQLLKSRLERRGVAVSPMMLASNWLAGTSTVVATPLIESTINVAFRLGAATAVSASVLSLTQGVLGTMLLNKLRSIAFVVLVAGGVSAGGVGVWAYHASQSSDTPTQDGGLPTTKESAKAAGPASTLPPWPQGPVETKQESLPVNRATAFPPMGLATFSTPYGKNAPNLVGPREGLPIYGVNSFIVVESPDRTSWEAMSLDAPSATWQKVTFPAGIKALPLMSVDALALILKGKTIDHVAAFSKYTGRWSKQHLLKAVEDEITPVLGQGSVLYQAGNDFYAFGARPGIWGVLHLEGAEKPRAQISTDAIYVLQGNTLYVFNTKLGQWSPGVAMNLHPFQSDPPPAATTR